MCTSIVRSWFAAGLLAVAGAAGAAELPRYALKPGMIVEYEERQSFQAVKENSETTTSRRAWVVGVNGDGSTRVIVRQEETWHDKSSSSTDKSTSLARFDVFPDGKITPGGAFGFPIDPTFIFPRLPADDKEFADGWRSIDSRNDATVQYKSTSGADVPFTFEADHSNFMEKAYAGKHRRVFRFDRKKGLVAHAEITRSFAYRHLTGKGEGNLELKAISEMNPAILPTFRAEMDRCFDANVAYQQASAEVVKAGDKAESSLKKARLVLADARAKLTLPEPIAAIDKLIEDHDQFAKYEAENARRFAGVLGKPAAAWGSLETPSPAANRVLGALTKANTASELKDLDGRSHSLAQYRGKVIVLDFWYRGCGWCMRAMPQVKKLAAHYRDQPVVVFGANNDQDEKDARFVVKEMAIPYPVLRSMDLPGRYGVRGFPTLVIVDKEGKVADVHVGYSDHLYDDVSASIDRLLAPAS